MLGTAIGIGVGGAAVAAAAGGDLRLGITAAFAVAAAVGLMALVFTRPPSGRYELSAVGDRPGARARRTDGLAGAHPVFRLKTGS